MCKVKSILIVLFITNHFNHATTENYEEQFPDEKEKESINNFIAWETKSFLEKLNEKRKKDKKEEITMGQIQNDEEVKKEKEILIDILNNFSETLQKQNEKRIEKIQDTKIRNKKCCYKLKIEAEKGIMFTSDTHADADTVEKIWYFFDQLKKQGKIDKLVFLGDYGDRGNYWTYTYFLLAAMAEKYGENIIFIRGNHEEIGMSYMVLCALEGNEECANNCWDEMPLICEITWNQKKIFCSHGAMPLNKNGEWLEYEAYKNPDYQNKSYFLANWNDNIFTEDPQWGIQESSRGAGYKIPIKEIFQNMVNNEYDWSIHGHIHKNQCGILKNKNKRVVTVVANEFYYNNNTDYPFLPAVYIINDKNLNGTFFNLLPENDKIKKLDKEKSKNMKVLNNCVIYNYDFVLQKTKKKIKEFDQEKPTNIKIQKKHVNLQDNINEEKKIDCNILKKIYCCCDICEK